MSNIERIDLEQFYALKDLLEDEFDGLVHSFFDDSAIKIQEIKKAFAEKDNRQGYESAHALKGASVNLGANLLSDIAYKIQRACSESNISNISSLISEVEHEVFMLTAELKKLS